ncbi:bacterial lipocalin [Idiomarina sp. A28L]|uniref:lipocalin family protein n=1 Tax=Idiomarina sp. A28L TaxID=1036674 RepID=UPI00021389EE|nr:lipocalin family protein [Idiomarina sp. A28L]EGN76248.1 bacterial lipocalin [Idiomarina sp. A28L]
MKKLLLLIIVIVAAGWAYVYYSSQPDPAVKPIENLDPERYMGTWYSILRLPHRFEKDLDNVTAEYRLNEDGTIHVTNKGYNRSSGEWKTATATAKPVPGMNAGFRVTFFWPFNGGYYVAELGSNYEYAVVVSDSKDYFWLLSRSPRPSQGLIDEVTARAYAWGYDIDQFYRVKHGPVDE